MSAFLSQDNSSKKYENGHWQSLLRFTKQSNTRFIKAKLNQPPPFGIPDRQTVTELLSLTGKDDDHREILEKHLLCGLLLFLPRSGLKAYLITSSNSCFVTVWQSAGMMTKKVRCTPWLCLP